MIHAIANRFLLIVALLAAGCAGDANTPAGEAQRSSTAAEQAKTSNGFVSERQTDHGGEVSRLVSEQDQIVSILENGLVVIAQRISSPVLSVRGNVRAGGIYEGPWLGGGVSHLLEHLVAGGSTQQRSEAENRRLLHELGNNSNAATYPDRTAYYINTTPENIDKALDLLTDWLFAARITPEEYAREYEVVQRELERNTGDPDWVFYHQTLRNRYQVSPRGVPTIGYQEVIRRLTRDDIYAYYRLAYQPNNMVISLAGDLPPDQMLRAVQQRVAQVPPGRAFSHDIADEPPVTGARTLVSTFPNLGQAKLQLAFPTIRLSHPDLYALDLLATILGQGESSILVERIRDEKGLVSSIGAWNYTPEYVNGTFMIQMELPTDNIRPAIAAVLEQIETVKREGVSEQRLQRAKVQTRTARAFSQQTAQAVADSLAADFMSTGDANFSDRYVERMQDVTAQQVQEMARKYLDPAVLLTTAMVPQEALGDGGLTAAEALVRSAVPTTRRADAPAGESKVTRVQLGDGTILLLKRVATAPVVSIHLYSLGGVTAEDQQTNGLGNLTMQMVPRGTRAGLGEDIARFFDSIGGDLNTACGNNTWSWTAACLKQDLPATLEVFADVVTNPSFPEDQFAVVRRRTIASIEAQDAHWFGQSMRFFRRTYFGPRNSPYQFMPVGTRQNVERFTLEQVRSWYADKVLAAPRVLAIYGDIDIDEAHALGARHFAGGLAAGAAPAHSSSRGNGQASPTTRPAAEAGPSLIVERVEVQQTRNPQAGVIIGFATDSVIGDPSLFPLTVADTMASGYGYPTGYLFETLRGQGLVYDVQAYIMPGRSRAYPGALVIYAVCNPNDVNAVVEGILLNMVRLQGSADDLQPDWFERSRRLIITTDALNNETAASQATTAALDELFGLGFDYHEHFADKVSRVQLDDVQAAARTLLRRCVVTVNTASPEAVTIRQGTRTYDHFPPVDLAPGGVQHDDAPAGQ